MDRSEKEAVVKDMTERLSRAQAVVLTDLTGLKVEQVTELRAQLTEKGLDYVVVKNRLMKLAVEGTDAQVMEALLNGPNAFGFAYDEPVDLAKILVDFAKTNPELEIKGGYLEGKILAPEDVSALAKLPSRDILLGQLLGVMNGVARNFVSVLAAVPRGLVTALQAVADQKAESEA